MTSSSISSIAYHERKPHLLSPSGMKLPDDDLDDVELSEEDDDDDYEDESND